MKIPVGIADHKKGIFWDGIEIIVTTFDENNNVVPFDFTGGKVISQFKTNNNVVFEFQTDDDTILIPEPTNGKLYFVGRNINIAPNTYLFDIKFIDVTNKTEEIIPTHSWTIYK